jgi:hypothetical protein
MAYYMHSPEISLRDTYLCFTLVLPAFRPDPLSVPLRRPSHGRPVTLLPQNFAPGDLRCEGILEHNVQKMTGTSKANVAAGRT